MSVSVIIPVHNAAPYLKKAVLSATSLPEVGEVILVEDHSQDHSLSICEELSSNTKVTLLTHPSNKGAAEARNTGLANISHQSKYVAFLDADDYYLKNRFKSCINYLEKNQDLDGTYGLSDHHFYSQKTKNHYIKLHDLHQGKMGVFYDVAPETLFEKLVCNEVGYFTLNTLTLKVNSINKIGLFDPTLRQCQDTDYIWKASLTLRLANQTGSTISTIGVHDNNRVLNRVKSEESRIRLFKKWITNPNPKITNTCRIHLIRSYLASKVLLRNKNRLKSLSLLIKTIDLIKLTYSSPDIIKYLFR